MNDANRPRQAECNSVAFQWTVLVAFAGCLASCTSLTLSGFGTSGYRATPDEPTWFCGGPPQSFVTAIAINPLDPMEMLLGADDTGGIYRSTDGGDTVEQVYGDFAGMNFAAAPEFNTVFACDSYGKGLRRSQDGGRSWEVVDADLNDSLAIADCAISPRDSNVVYAATLASFRGVSRKGGLYRSDDGGATWWSAGLQGTNCDAVVISAAVPESIYVAVDVAGIKCSDDGGGTWESRGLENKIFRDLLLDPRDAEVIIAATLMDGIYRTDDDGKTWAKTTADDEDPWISRIAQCEAKPEVMYAATLGSFVPTNPHPYGGVLKSSDGGRTWDKTTLPDVVSISVAVDPVDPERVYVGTYGGEFYRSIDGGATWHPVGKGLRTSYITSRPFIDPKDPRTVYVGTHGTARHCVLWKTHDRGATWQSTGARDFGGNEISGAAVAVLHVGNETVMLLGLRYENAQNEPAAGLVRSCDLGQTWTKVLDANLFNLRVAADGSVFALTKGKGLWISSDAGATWSSLGTDGKNVFDVWTDPANPKRMLAALALGDAGILESNDAGNTWTASSFPEAAVYALEQDPSDSSQVYAASQRGLYVSQDGGQSWRLLYDFGVAIYSVCMDKLRHRTMYVTSRDLGSDAERGMKRGVWRSTDSGATWEHISGGAITQQFGHGVALGPDGTLWAGSVANGLWRHGPTK